MTHSKLLIPVLSSLLFVPITGANAASICKGLDEVKCGTLEVYTGVKACGWVKERQRADGGVTKAYCRGSGKSVPTDAVKAQQPQTAKN